MKTIFLVMMTVSLLCGSYTRDATSKTVYDSQTNLTWEDGKNHLYKWEGAIGYCESLNFGGVQDWRLPNVNEMLSIVDYHAQGAAINPVFSYLVNEPYWSATTNAGKNDEAWYVNFSDGYSRSFPKDANRRYVRCVRQGKLSSSGSSGNAATLPAIFYLLQ